MPKLTDNNKVSSRHVDRGVKETVSLDLFPFFCHYTIDYIHTGANYASRSPCCKPLHCPGIVMNADQSYEDLFSALS